MDVPRDHESVRLDSARSSCALDVCFHPHVSVSMGRNLVAKLGTFSKLVRCTRCGRAFTGCCHTPRSSARHKDMLYYPLACLGNEVKRNLDLSSIPHFAFRARNFLMLCWRPKRLQGPIGGSSKQGSGLVAEPSWLRIESTLLKSLPRYYFGQSIQTPIFLAGQTPPWQISDQS